MPCGADHSPTGRCPLSTPLTAGPLRAGKPPSAFLGVCPGSYGELYQGPLPGAHGHDPPIALVSLPADRKARVYFTSGGTGTAPVPPYPKSARAVQLLLNKYQRTLPTGSWTYRSELPVGVGMASSTADLVATLRCLFQVLELPYDQRVVTEVLAAIERSDSVFLPEFALYLSGRHQLVRRLGTAVRFHTCHILESGTVDTQAVTPLLLPHYRKRASAYERCLTELLKGFRLNDPLAIARAATSSASLSQEVLPKATFDTVLAHRATFRADGVFVAHTGSLVGYLYLRRPPPGLADELSAFFRALGHSCAFAQGGCL